MSARPKRSLPVPATAASPKEPVQPAKKKAKTDGGDNSNSTELASAASAESAAAAEHKKQQEAAMLNFLSNYESVFSPLLGTNNFIASRRVPQPRTVPYVLLERQPQEILATLKSYQMIGVSFLIWLHENGANGILGDEMGLGKTVTTLSLFAWLKETKGVAGPHLVVCPLSVLSSWMNEIAKWFPTAKSLRFHGQANERSRLMDVLRVEKPDIVVATYESYRAEEKRLKHAGNWQYLVLDEGHKVKNHKSAVSASLQNISAQHRLLLTGTPLQNNLAELWSLLRWLWPMVFTPTTEARFLQAFDLVHGTYDQDFMNASKKLLELLMLRRTKEGVKKELSVPPREEMTIFVPLTPLQRFWYQRLLTKVDTSTFNEIFRKGGGSSSSQVNGNGKPNSPAQAAAVAAGLIEPKVEEGGAAEETPDSEEQVIRESVQKTVEETKKGRSQWQSLMSLLMQLRKICNHPYSLLDGAPDPYYIGEHIIMASAKLQLLDKLLMNKILPAGEQTLIFSGFTSMLDLVEDYLNLRDIPHARLDGSTSRPRRTLDIKIFNQDPSPYRVYLISTRAGGLGLNLASATNVVMADLDFNPQVTLQAIARAHRIGQEKTVKVYNLVTEDSVESQMLTRIAKKTYLSAKVLGSSSANMANTATSTPALTRANSTTSINGTDTPTEDDMQQPEGKGALSASDLVSILKGGSAALSGRWGGSGGESDGLQRFQDASIDEILAHSRKRQDQMDAQIKVDVGGGDDATSDEVSTDTRKLAEEAAAAEAEMLSGIERVQTRLFEGRVHARRDLKSNKDIRKEWEVHEKRVRKERVVQIDGHDVSAETLSKDPAWTAVKTLTSDPKTLASLQTKKREKRKFDHQSYCLNCHDGGEVFLCGSCPRVMHSSPACSGMTKTEIKKMLVYRCPQHNCGECGKTTADAGGLLFRCRSCPQSYCDDCLPDSGWVPVGDTIPDFEIVGYGKVPQAYYISCGDCEALFATDAEALALWQAEQKEVDREMKRLKEQEEREIQFLESQS